MLIRDVEIPTSRKLQKNIPPFENHVDKETLAVFSCSDYVAHENLYSDHEHNSNEEFYEV